MLKKLLKIFDISMLKFCLVGVVNTICGAGVMFLLYNLLGASYYTSSAANYIVGGTVSWFLNKSFTFKDNKKRSFREASRQVFIFIINLLVCYIIAYSGAKRLMMILLVEQPQKIQENIAMLVGMVLYTGLNYFGQRFLVFNKKDPK